MAVVRMTMTATSQAIAAQDLPTRGVLTIPRADLLALLSAKDSPELVALVTVTSARLKKRNNPYLGDLPVLKATLVTCTLNGNYTDAVNRGRLAEGKSLDFIPDEPTWGTRRGKSPIYDHDGKVYLRYMMGDVGGKSYGRPYGVGYSQGGKAIPTASIRPYLADGNKSEGSFRQALDNPVIIRTPFFASVAEITVDGVFYRIADERDAVDPQASAAA